MSNSFQQSFVHLVAANNALNGLPRLQPAPTALPTGLTPTSPPSLHLPTLPLSVLQPAPGAPSPPTPPPLAFPPLALPAPASLCAHVISLHVYVACIRLWVLVLT